MAYCRASWRHNRRIQENVHHELTNMQRELLGRARLETGIRQACRSFPDRTATFPHRKLPRSQDAGFLRLCVPDRIWRPGRGLSERFMLVAAEIGRWCGTTADIQYACTCATMYTGFMLDHYPFPTREKRATSSVANASLRADRGRGETVFFFPRRWRGLDPKAPMAKRVDGLDLNGQKSSPVVGAAVSRHHLHRDQGRRHPDVPGPGSRSTRAWPSSRSSANAGSARHARNRFPNPAPERRFVERPGR